MDALLESAMNQNFIPVIDDLDNFIGIVTRRDIISYLAENENSFAPLFPNRINKTPPKLFHRMKSLFPPAEQVFKTKTSFNDKALPANRFRAQDARLPVSPSWLSPR